MMAPGGGGGDERERPKALTVEFGGITKDNVAQLRKINAACFPIQYAPGFYKDVAERKDSGLCKFAYCNGFVVGAACARVEPIPIPAADADAGQGQGQGRGGGQRLYMMTLAVLAAYRDRGVGTALLRSVLDHFEEHKDEARYAGVLEIALHVQISNDDALRFYTEGFGFEKGPMVENYYQRIDPPHCYVLSKKLR